MELTQGVSMTPGDSSRGRRFTELTSMLPESGKRWRRRVRNGRRDSARRRHPNQSHGQPRRRLRRRLAERPPNPNPIIFRRPIIPIRLMTKIATIETNKGTMKAELYEKEAPKTVANFEKLANSGFYDGTRFHRVIKDFVVQGGDPYSKGGEHAKGPVGTGGPGWKINCETAGNPHKHQVGSLSMAHAGKNTGGSQFFMVLSEQNTKHLNGVHTVFGKITGGIDVMKQIKKNDVMPKVRVA